MLYYLRSSGLNTETDPKTEAITHPDKGRTPGVYFIRMKNASMHAPACRSSSPNAYLFLSGWRTKRYSNVVGMAVCPGMIPPAARANYSSALCGQASPSGNVLPVSVIPLRPPLGVEKSRQTGYGLFRGFQITVAVAAIRAIFIAGPCIGCGHRHSAGWQNLSCCVIERSSCRLVVY